MNQSLRNSQIRVVMMSLGGAVAFMLAVVLVSIFSRSVQAAPPPIFSPLQLSVVSVPEHNLAAAPPGGFPSNVDITFTSSGGPFCLQGLTIDPAVETADPVGTTLFYLSRINGSGLSHPSLQIAEGNGFSPLDIVVAYGSQICASSSIQFHATQFTASSGPGQAIHLFGTAIVLASPGVTVSVS